MATKPKLPQKENLDNVVDGRDLFETPNYATDLLIPFIPKTLTSIWECAAGSGKIMRWLYERTDLDVYCSDIRTDDEEKCARINFLSNRAIWDFAYVKYGIITNPPFSLKKKFYEKCRSYNVPFALLIPADYSGWIIKAVQDGAEKVIPTRRIDFITPSGKESHAQFHSMWLTWGFGIGRTETFVELTTEMKKNI